MCLAVLPLVTGCAEYVSDDSACRNLVYEDGGLSRRVYLPCAGEIMAALDVVDPKTRLALEGDQEARAEGAAALRQAKALMQTAGGRNLLERWDDRALTSMNISISNAVSHYEAFYMLRVYDKPHPYASKMREAAESEYRGATRTYHEARSQYRNLK